MTKFLMSAVLLALLAACTPPEAPEAPEDEELQPVPLSVPLATE